MTRDQDTGDRHAGAFQPMSRQDFANWGTGHIAYIKHQETPDGLGFVIHAANGEPLASATTRDLAAAAAMQNDLEPFSVH